MSRMGHKVGLKRDARDATVPAVPAVGFDPFEVRTVPWQPRAGDDDRRAILASERSAVFDRPSADVLKAREEEGEAATSPDVGALGPVPNDWTPDLVHCRLVSVYWLCAELPRIQWPMQYRSVLEQLQPATMTAPGRRRVLSGTDMDRIDWTLSCVCRCREDDQLILRGFMAGLSLRDIAEELRRLRSHGIGLGKGVGKDAVLRRYRALAASLAEQWSAHREPIDADTRRVWSTKAEKNL